MALSAFDDKSKKPGTNDLKKALGRAFTHWVNLMAHLETEYAPLTENWKFYSGNWGWSLQLQQKKRTILYLTPGKGCFVVGFALGEKAVKAAHDTTLPDSILVEIDGARKYAEGRAIRLEIRSKIQLENVKKLAAIKMAN